MRRLFDRLATTGDRMTAWGLRLLAGRGVRKAWLVVASVSAVFMLLTGTIQVTSLIAHEEVIEVSEIAVVGVTGIGAHSCVCSQTMSNSGFAAA